MVKNLERAQSLTFSLKLTPLGDLLRKIQIFDSNNEVIRNFLDRILADKSEIHMATLDNDKSIFEKSKNLDINYVDKLGRTALHLAAFYGYEMIVEILLKHNADINIVDNIFGWTPLGYAIKSNYWNIAELLLPEKVDNKYVEIYGKDIKVANIKGTNEEGKTPLHIAALNGYRKVAKALLLNGADVNACDIDKATPLQSTSSLEGATLEIIKLLIENKAYVNTPNKWG